MTTLAVVVHRKEGAELLASWGRRFARALEMDLLVIWVADSVARSETTSATVSGGDLVGSCPADAESLLRDLCASPEMEPAPAAESAGEASPPPPFPSVELVCPASLKRRGDDRVLDIVRERGVAWLVVAPPKRKRQSSLARRLFRKSPCHTILLHPGATDGSLCRRILVPTAGGPSARRALLLADRLARATEGASVEAFFVEPTAVEHGEEVGRVILDRALDSAGLGDLPHVTRIVRLADDLTTAIESHIEEDHDLVLLGASHVGVVRAQLFGTVPERLLGRPDGLAVGVVREQWSLGDRLRAQVGRWLDLRIPQLSRDQRVELFRRIQGGSEWSFDFLFLIALSTLIAALGLLQSSAAVVIGAMLVAPLMTPILGIGLALLQGNWPLLRSSTRAVVSGYLLALALGAGLGWLTAPSELTTELWARGGPTLLDMGVGFFAGLAAAYCLGRPGLTAALPGVAIAAALVPPIATTGIALSRAEWGLAEGSSLLFGTNVVAIVLGCSASLYAVGVRAREQPTPAQRRTRLLVAGLMAVLCVLAVPLTESWIDALDARRSQGLDASLIASLRRSVEASGVGWVEASWRGTGDGRNLRVTVEAAEPLSAEATDTLLARLRDQLPPGSSNVRIRVATLLVATSETDRAPSPDQAYESSSQ